MLFLPEADFCQGLNGGNVRNSLGGAVRQLCNMRGLQLFSAIGRRVCAFLTWVALWAP
jgi:hypothetical protein